MKKFMIKLGFVLFEIGVGIFINAVFGKQTSEKLQVVVQDLSYKSDLTPRQKYNRAKKFLDVVAQDVPDQAKNIAIEAAVIKITKNADSLLKKVR